MPVAVLLSGSGRTLENLLTKSRDGEVPVTVAAVVASRGDTRGVEVARAAGLPCAVIRRRDHADADAHNAAVNAWLAPFAPRMIVLAGYLCFYQAPAWLDGPVLNIHPALLPRHGGRGMWGHHVHESVLAAGDRESGCTVHLVSDVYDAGEILAQTRVPVLPGDSPDTLAARVFAAECELYPRVIAAQARQLLDAPTR
ncbi:MAG: phosphoribosylglycinamide formyltransferase [Gemmatimonas sp.]|nr:phosphoribosylglycinamide formyltransferase [Gemmatimonas sp.]